MNFLDNLVNIGIFEGQSDHDKKKIQRTNQVIFFTFFMSVVPFAAICATYFPSLLFIPAIGGVLSIIIFVFNALGSYQIARFFISILPSIIVIIFHSLLIPKGVEPVSGTLLLNFAFALFPFVLYDLKEYPYLIFTSLVTFFTVFSTTFMIDLLELDEEIDYMLLKEGVLGGLNIGIGLIVGFGVITILAMNNRKTERKNESLIVEMGRHKHELKESEDVLKNTIKKFEEAQELEKQRKLEDEKRNWATEGLAKFGDLLRQHSGDIKEFGYKIISNLVEYLGANQGGIFIINDDDEKNIFIELIASCAYDRRKYIKKSIKMGEGIVGACVLEGETILMTDVPNNYINITSGLGTANPKSILVVPLKLNESIYGVVEIASFNKFESYQIEFIENVGEDIASTIASVKVNIKTTILLEQTSLQTEQMQAQEEEMRQNMEEMMATQEESVRRETDLENNNHILQEEIERLQEELQNAVFSEDNEKMFNLTLQLEALNAEKLALKQALDISVAVIEYDLEGNILMANSNMLGILGCRLADLEGKNHRDFASEQEVESIEYGEFWKNLVAGNSQEGEFFHLVPSGDVWLYENYTPVKNEKGEYFKVITICSDITKEKMGF